MNEELPLRHPKTIAENVILLDPAECVRFKGNGRSACLFDKARRADAELLHSMETNGQQTPVIVRRLEDGRYEVVAGTRRQAATLEINAQCEGENATPRKLLAVVRVLTDDQAFECATAENEGCAAFTKLQVARQWEWELAARHEGEQKKLAAAKNVSISVVSRTLAMLSLPTEVVGLLKDPEKVTPYLAEQIAPALADADRRDEIIAHAVTLAAGGMKFTPSVLARTLLLSPTEQQLLADKVVPLCDVPRAAIARTEAGGTFVLRLKPIAANVTRQDRRKFMSEIAALVARHVEG